MTYRLLTKSDDREIPILLSVYRQPAVSQFVSIDEENYWRYITDTGNVFFYKVYQDGILVAAVHLELAEGTLYMSVVVFPEHQNQGIAAAVLQDIQEGRLGPDFRKIQVWIHEKNTASLRLFEGAGFVCTGKDGELFEYSYFKSECAPAFH